MVDFLSLKNKLNENVSINSLDIFSITYNDSIVSFIEFIIKEIPSIQINIYFNINKNFKDFIYTNNIFNKFMYLSTLSNLSLYQTDSTDQVIIVNKNLANSFDLNTLSKLDKLDSNIFNYKNFNINLLAKIYIIYVSNKTDIFDSEFKTYYNKNNKIIVTPANVPQFSSLDDACNSSVNVIAKHDKITYIELGKLINPRGENTEGAQKKYGENHGKFSNLLDLSFINNSHIKNFTITPLGKLYVNLNSDEKYRLLKFQFYKLFVIQYIISNNISTKDELLAFLLSANLSSSTAKRRLPNVNSIMKFLDINN